jgi:hypothetical protein
LSSYFYRPYVAVPRKPLDSAEVAREIERRGDRGMTKPVGPDDQADLGAERPQHPVDARTGEPSALARARRSW